MRHTIPLSQCIPLGVLFLFALCCNSLAQHVTDISAGFCFRRFQTDSGLPESTVTAMAQTPDGYIWCATLNGLARFDVRFEVFDLSNTPDLPTDRLIKLGVTKSGALVIVTEFGDVVVRSNGRFRRCVCGRSCRNDAIIEDPIGRLWTSRLDRATGVSWTPLEHTGEGGLRGPCSVVIPLIYTNIGPWIVGGNTMYVADEQGLRRGGLSGGWEEATTPVSSNGPVALIYPGKTEPWLVTSNLYCRWQTGAVTRSIKRPITDRIIRLLECRNGEVWLVSYHGKLYHVDSSSGDPSEVNLPGVGSTWVPCAFLDREDNLWLALASVGLVEVQCAAMHRISTEEGLLSDIVRTVSEDCHGNIWACTGNGINTISSQGVATELKNNFVWTAIPSGGPTMWVATYSDGLYLVSKGSRYQAPGISYHEWEPPDFNVLFTGSAGDLWFGNSAGLFRYDGSNAFPVALPVTAPPDIRAIAEAADGTLYVGSNGQGLFVRNKQTQQWQRFFRNNGLESEVVYSLHVDSKGVLWLGTSGAGLARFDGRRFSFFKRWVSDLPRTVTGIEEDALGYLWVGSTHGIFRAKLSDLNAAAEDPSHSVPVVEYGRTTGLLSSESVAGVQPSVAKGRDGRIWFATTGGVVCFDPKEIPVNPLHPPVVIEAVTSGDCHLDLSAPPSKPPKADPPLRVSLDGPRTVFARPGTDPIEFDFTGLSFTAPENVHFRYRMEGLESKWTRTRERKATYQRLPPGRYTFHVSACNNSGIWNEAGASLAVVQLPFFWQTAWFESGVVLTIIGLVYGAYRYRLIQLARISQLRVRIAADIHDEVGSNMGAVVLNSDLLTLSPNLSPEEREQIADIHRLAQNTAHALREISWFINPDFDYLDEMLARMKEAAGRLSKSHRVNFSAPDSVPKTRLSLEFRRNVIAIYKEALNNAGRHSGATRIEIIIRLESGRLGLQITDDGCGFDPGQESAGQGLRNLRQRAEALGGALEIQSAPGAGTKIRFEGNLH